MSKSALSRLIELAEKILDSAPENLEPIEDYVNSFERFQADGDLQTVSALSAKELMKLQELHTKVMALSRDLQEETAESLKALAKKGKGFSAYMRVLSGPANQVKTNIRKG